MPNDLNLPINGINSDSHEEFRKEMEFNYMLNGNIQEFDGNGLLAQNEHSNILCSSFKPGYDVVHTVTDTTNNCIYYFLANETTGCSEIGKICGENEFEQEDEENSCGCGEYSEDLADRLEGSVQTPTCEYTTIISDCCPGLESKCLEFSRDKLYSSTLKIEENQKYLYFTDGITPMRRIDLANTDQYTYTKDDCTGEITQKCLDCEQLRVMQEHEKPCLSVDKLINGGELTEGAYLALIAYVDEVGNKMTNFMSETNWVMVHNNNDKILMPNELARVTSKAIKYKISNLDDKKYKYYSLAFVTKKNVMDEVEYFETPPIPINQNEYTLSSLLKANGIKRIALNEISDNKIYYETAKFVNQINNRLFWFGLTMPREYNLQPVVNLLGEFVKVRTMVADEGLYEDGANCAKYEQFMGDEVYPLGLRFFGKNGFFSSLFPLIGRAPKDVTINGLTFNEKDKISVNDTNYKSIQTFTPVCEGSERDEMWQYYNTAHEDEQLDCPIPAGMPSSTQTKSFKRIAKSIETEILAKVVELKESDGSLNPGEQWVNLTTYINNHKDIFTSGSTAVDVFGLRVIMAGLADLTQAQANALFTCKTPTGDATKLSEIISVLNEGDKTNLPVFSSIDTYKPLSEYDIPQFNSEMVCSNKQRNSEGLMVQDQEASDLLNAGTIVIIHKRKSTITTCGSATELIVKTPSVPSNVATQIHVGYSILGTSNAGDYATTIPSIGDPNTSRFFLNNLHKNAVWHKFKTTEKNETVLLVSKTSECERKDDMDYSNPWMRISIYDACNGTLKHSEIYDINNGYKFKFNTASGFNKNTTYYVAFDTPILSAPFRPPSTGLSYYSSGTCGCFEVTYEESAITKQELSVSNYLLSKNITYERFCEVLVPADIKCNPYIDKQYNFAYWESSENYPCNDELWDSSKLTIASAKIPSKYKTRFEELFTTGTSGGNYTLNVANTKFTDKPIRHFKFPDDRVAPHQDNQDEEIVYGSRNKIYIKGIWIDNELINAMLDVAFDSGLITKKERDSIIGYEIYRGDRRLNRSIIAKGLAYDMLEYKDEGGMKWQTPNYPFNQLGNDTLHRYNNEHPTTINNQGRLLSFHSPETSYDLPDLGTEVKLEMFKYGGTSGRFAAVEDYPKYIILSQAAFRTAELLANAQYLLDSILKYIEIASRDNEVFRIDIGFTNSLNAGGIIQRQLNFIAFYVTQAANYAFKVGQYKSEWIKIFYENGTPRNFASMYVGRCRYENTYRDNEASLLKTINNSVRGVAKSFRMQADRYQVSGSGYLDVNINNKDREGSIYINLGDLNGQKYPFDYPPVHADSSRFVASQVDACDNLISQEINDRNAFSPYISLKHYLPNQYGTINSLMWVNTCYCGRLVDDNSCDVVFGGDTYISRFSVKRKMRFFYEDSWNAVSLTPFNHSEYYNMAKPVHYLDYNNTMSANMLGFAEYPTIESDYGNMDCIQENGNYVTRAKFYLYYYGITHFLVESNINNNFRYGQNDKEKNFYENVADYVAWCQNKNVHISEPNRFYYNPIFSTDQQNITGTRVLPSYYNRIEWDAANNVSDRLIYSQEDSSKKQLYVDPYMIYKGLDFKDFGKELGKPFGIHSIEDMKAVAVFEDAFVVFNAYSELPGSVDSYQLGDGNLFKTRPTTLFKTDLGYAGTQSRAFKKTQFGHFWIDSKRGTIHNIQSGAKDYQEISDNGTYNWFKENLPFNILKDFKDLDEDTLDNPINGLGIAMGWDNRFQRLFITKKDARVKPEFKSRITYKDKNFFLDTNVKIYANDSRFFDDSSWTRAYMPKMPKDMNKWISFYSFKPHAYIEHIDYFQTLINTPGNSSVWSHLRTNKSYQVFYNQLYPFKVEVAYKSNFFNKQFSNLEWWLDVQRYHDEYDFAKIEERNFDYAVFYNKAFNTGKLNLINRDYNNLYQEATHPKFNSDSVDILSSFDDSRWFINDIYDMNNVHNKNVPIWINAKGNDDKTLNPKAFYYVNKLRDRMRMDTANLLLVQEKESRLKYILKMAKNLHKPFD